jgi:hypothetical protein
VRYAHIYIHLLAFVTVAGIFYLNDTIRFDVSRGDPYLGKILEEISLDS